MLTPKAIGFAALIGVGAFIAFLIAKRGVSEKYSAPLGDYICPPISASGEYLTDPKAIETLEDCISALPQTKYLHTDREGEYTPERAELHDKIIEELMKQAECVERQDNPIAILTGGVPGSGKSSFIRKFAPWMDSKKAFHIDADAIRAMLPEYQGWNASQTQAESRDIVNHLLASVGTPCRYDIVYDGTMNKAKKYDDLIKRLRNIGYKIYVIFMDVPPHVSVERVINRYKNSKDHRYVPMEVVTESAQAGMSAFDEIKTMVDGWVTVDGQKTEIIEEGGEKLPRNRYWESVEEHFIAEKNTSPQSISFGALDKECYKKLDDGTKVCDVNGTHVRDNIYQDFTMGGHDKVYDFIPDGEIWIDRDMVRKDKNATIVHESKERTKMEKEGWHSTKGSGYLRAHEIANKAEKKYRKEHN